MARQSLLEIIDHREVAPDHWELVFPKAKGFQQAEPGQFVMLLVRQDQAMDPLLRRPLSIFRVEEDLDAALGVTPNVLSLVLDARGRAGVSLVAREVGASHVLSGPVPPPLVLEFLARWLALGRRRAETDGWSGNPEPPAEPWLAWLAPTPSASRTTSAR